MRRHALVALILAAGGCSSSDTPDSGMPGSIDSGPAPAAFSDDFGGAVLDSHWASEGPMTPGVAGGSLALRMDSGGRWYQDEKGGFVRQLVTGNFRATATVHARKTSNTSTPPTNLIHLGGLMARNPAYTPHENFVHVVIGNDGNTTSVVETKTTVAGVSTWTSAGIAAGQDAMLRLCRVGADFYLYIYDPSTSSWTQRDHFTRTDLPATLQVGPSIYAYAPVDLTVSFDEVRFTTPASAADCATP